MIKGETSIDKAVRMYNDRVKALLDRIFPEVVKWVTVRHNVKWFDSEAKQLQIKHKKYERNG